MVSVNSFAEIENFVQQNQLKINILHEINAFLNDRYEIKTNYQSLNNELKSLRNLETNRKDQYNKEKQNELINIEHLGQNLCQEHSKLLHQIEHINWHLGHAHPHELSTPIEHPHIFSKNCHSSASIVGHNHSKLHCSNKPSANMGYLQISAERFIKTIAELRRKICQTKQNLEQEIERKKIAEKNLSDMRKEVSNQKKLMTMKRCVPLPAITAVKKCVK